MEKRDLKISIAKRGGNSSKNAVGYRLILPTAWAKEMGIELDSRDVTATFDNGKITIEKIEKETDKIK